MMKVVRKMASILDQKFQDAEQRFFEVMYGTKKVRDEALGLVTIINVFLVISTLNGHIGMHLGTSS